MNNEFKREERYVVFKVSDLGNSLKGDEIRRLAREYAEQRRLKGKEPLECVVVEKDWPEYESTWRAIEARVTNAQPVPSVPDSWKLVPEKHPTFDPVDLQLSDGSVLCGCVPQSDGDYWWKGPSGEVFIDPKYASVTHWRLAAAPEVNK